MTIPIAPPRQAAKLSSPLQRSLSMYALAAGAAGVQLLALAPASEAEVVYTPANVALGRNQSYFLDLNHDGINDFTIKNQYAVGSTYQGARLEIHPDKAGGIGYQFRTGWGDLAAVFRKGQNIGKSVRFDYGYAMMALKVIISGIGGSYGSWLNIKNGYLGLIFKFDGQFHYGWARVGLRFNGLRMFALIKDYAYETQPDTPIIAGDTGGVADDAANDEPRPTLVPAHEVSPRNLEPSPPSLGTLAFGAPGLAIWRREDS